MDRQSRGKFACTMYVKHAIPGGLGRAPPALPRKFLKIGTSNVHGISLHLEVVLLNNDIQ